MADGQSVLVTVAWSVGVVGIAFGGYTAVSLLVDLHERGHLWQLARDAANRRGKPMLVVGSPKAQWDLFPLYPYGDVTIDIEPHDVQVKKVDVMEVGKVFAPKQFGSAFVSHVLEHVSDPVLALQQLYKVADEVFIAGPSPWGAMAWLVPSHRWIIHQAPPYGTFKFGANPLYREGL